MLAQQLLDNSVRKYPKNLALSFRGIDFTYEEFASFTNKTASFLISAGVQRGDRVAIFLNKSQFSLLSIYGVLKADAIYVPLDPNAPVERILKIINDCDVRFLISHTDKISAVREILEARPKQGVLFIDGRAAPELKLLGNIHDGNDIKEQSGGNLGYQSVDKDPAYIIYTSGSTGQPKGVVITHRNIVDFTKTIVEKFNVTERDRISNHPPIHFDLSTLDVYLPFSAGAAIFPVPEEYSLFPADIVNFIKENKLTIWNSVPFLLSYIARMDALKDDIFPDLKSVIWCGEAFPVKFLRHWMLKLPKTKFFNTFGPTETTVMSMYYDITAVPDENASPTPIGKAFKGEEVFAIDASKKKVEPGETGELYIRGTGVGAGYWNDKEKTALAFVQNPLHNNYQDTVYKTGDLVRLMPDGNYEFLGRADYQVKCRGFRIELGEIETAIYSHKAVAECAVLPVNATDMGNVELKAFIAFKPGAIIDIAELKDYLKGKVPHYMVPHYFQILSAFPLTGTGKIDRIKLKQM